MSLIRLQRLLLPMILVLGISCHAMDEVLKTAAVILFVFTQEVEGITVTDEWTFSTTNAQNVLGAVGLLTLTFNFFSAYLFYRKTQSKYKKVLKAHINDLEQRNKFLEDDPGNNLVKQALEFIEPQEPSLPADIQQ